MSRMSEQHDALSVIHAIMLGQRKVAQNILDGLNDYHQPGLVMVWSSRIETINDLLLEIEAAGVVWPDNIVEADFTQCWPKEF